MDRTSAWLPGNHALRADTLSTPPPGLCRARTPPRRLRKCTLSAVRPSGPPVRLKPDATLATRCGRREQPAHLFKVFGRVHAQRVIRRLDGLDADAMLESAQLFQRFGPFERCRLQACQNEQGVTPVCIQADMSVEGGPAAPRVAGVRNRGARK